MCQAPSTSTPSPDGSLPVLLAEPRSCGCGGHGHGAGDTPKTVHSLQDALQVDESVRWVDASHDLGFPAVPFPSLRIYRSAGEAMLRALVLRHHTLLLDSPVAHLFPTDPEKFARGTAKTADFIVEACGGPARFSTEFGHTCMRTRHFPFTIDEAGRETWLQALWQAFNDVGFPTDVREEYWNWVEAMSIRMINRRTTKAQPARHPFSEMSATAIPESTTP